jgi:Homeodomain-like domain
MTKHEERCIGWLLRELGVQNPRGRPLCLRGTKLQQVRAARAQGLSLRKVAALYGISHDTVWRMTRGEPQ